MHPTAHLSAPTLRAGTIACAPRRSNTQRGRALQLLHLRRDELEEIGVLTPPSDISGLPYLLHQGELLSLRDPHKWILRPILGLGRDRYVFAVYHPCWLVTTPGVLISGHIGVGVIFSGRKGGYL